MEQQQGQHHGDDLRNGERPPHGGQSERYRQEIGHWQDDQELPGDGSDQAVYAVAQCLEYRTADDAEAGEDVAEADDAQGGAADGQQVVGRVKQLQQNIRNELEHGQAKEHHAYGCDDA